MIKIINLGLRGSVLASKFLTVFIIAYFLSPSDVALYGIVAATVAYSLYALGFDFYNYSIRELLSGDRTDWLPKIRNQLAFFFFSYLIVLPSLLAIFFLELLPWRVAVFFYVLIICEHLAQEVNRLLVAFSRQITASVVLFLRAGIWPLAVIFVFFMFPEWRTLNTVLTLWCAASFMGCVLGFMIIFKASNGPLVGAIDWKWIGKGIKVSLPFLIATMALRGILTIDRYWVEGTSSHIVAASYVIYVSISNAVLAFLDAGVFVFIYPGMVECYRKNYRKKFEHAFSKMLKQTLFVCVALSLVLSVAFPYAMGWVGKSEYLDNLPLFYIVLAAISLFCISMVPHYGLYAISMDRHIFISHITAFIVFIAGCFLMTRLLGGYGVGWALLLAFLYILAYKTLAYIVLREKAWLKITNDKEFFNV